MPDISGRPAGSKAFGGANPSIGRLGVSLRRFHRGSYLFRTFLRITLLRDQQLRRQKREQQMHPSLSSFVARDENGQPLPRHQQLEHRLLHSLDDHRGLHRNVDNGVHELGGYDRPVVTSARDKNH